ncbi:MAG: hypothetical protein AAGF93_20965 [Cyanobacteria bacterium P01_H01_bin.105]
MQVFAIIQRHIHHQRIQTKMIESTLRAGALLTGAVMLLATHAAHARMVMQSSSEADTAVIHPLLAQAAPSVPATLSNDGIYLFGEQPLPDQLQTAYMIFEARAGQVVGAFYSPHSSFDCFQGNVENTQLSLAITETYSQEEYAYNLDLEDTAVAGPGGPQFGIEGFHQIDAVSDNDMRMLSTCQAHYSQTI